MEGSIRILFSGAVNLESEIFIKNFCFPNAGDASQNGGSANGSQNGAPNSHTMLNPSMAVVPMTAAGASGAVPGPATNLNIGMDYWGAPSSAIPAIRGKVPTTPVAGGLVTSGSRDGAQSQLWLQVGLFPSFEFSCFLIMV